MLAECARLTAEFERSSRDELCKPFDAELYDVAFDIAALKPSAILHVGGHIGQEIPKYISMGVRTVLWVEPVPEFAKQLRENSPEGWDVVEAAAGSNDGEADFFVCDQLSSLFTLGPMRPLAMEPTRTPVRTVDSIVREHSRRGVYDLMVTDAQGGELEVLRGAGQTLKQLRHVICELLFFDYYVGGAKGAEVIAHMRDYGYAVRCVDPLIWTHALCVTGTGSARGLAASQFSYKAPRRLLLPALALCVLCQLALGRWRVLPYAITVMRARAAWRDWTVHHAADETALAAFRIKRQQEEKFGTPIETTPQEVAGARAAFGRFLGFLAARGLAYGMMETNVLFARP